MKKTMGVALAAIALSVGGGCVKTGSAHEKAPLTQDLGAYKSAAVEVDIPNDVKNADSRRTAFASMLGDKLKDKQIFSQIVPGSGDLTVRVHFTSVDEGNKLAQALGPSAGGDSEVAASVELFDTKQNKSVGAFDVTGNSKKNVQTSVGGVNTSAMEDSTGRAMGAAADEITDYLAKHKAGAK